MIKLALLEILRRPGQKLIVALAMFLTVGLLTIFLAAFFQIQGVMVVAQKLRGAIVMWGDDKFPETLAKTVASMDGVATAFPEFVGYGAPTDGRSPLLINAAKTDLFDQEWFRNFFWVEPDVFARWVEDPTAVILGQQSAKLWGLKEGSRFTLRMAGNNWLPSTDLPLHVVGLSYRGAKPNGVFIHMKYYQAHINAEHQANLIRVFLLPGVNEAEFIASVSEKFRNTGYAFDVFSGATYLLEASNKFKTVPSLLGIAGLILLIVTTVVTTSLYAISVRSRLSQFAVLSALGFRRSAVFRLILFEAALVCMGGGALGAVLPALVFRNGIESGFEYVGSVQISLPAVGASLVFAVVTSLLVGLLPARQAAATPVLQGLTAP